MEQIAMGKNYSGFIVSQGQFLLSPRLLSMHIFRPLHHPVFLSRYLGNT